MEGVRQVAAITPADRRGPLTPRLEQVDVSVVVRDVVIAMRRRSTGSPCAT
ncbi:hypothetical protein AB0J35_53665 [Nonomuraea angiospora]|uniref:hypothetical protein n=1 Tax=Nonomuraea angiospora TaxID=46172 RepID=UPI003423AA8C